MEIFKKTSFWILSCAILYSIGILLFWTSDILSKGDADKISAFGSILGAIGSFFAAFVAIYLFSDWRVVKNYELVKETSLTLLNAILNINSDIESLLSITYEFENLEKAEFDEFNKMCADYSRNFMNNLIVLKSKNNLHHGLVRNFENDTKLFDKDDLELITNIFDKIATNIELVISNYYLKNQNPTGTIKQLEAIDLNKYSKMVRVKIILLNKECKPN